MEGNLELESASSAAGFRASFIVIAVILSTIVMCTFVGNLFVIVAILVDKNLQTTANQLVLSLAVADLMVACLVMPLGAYNDIHQGWWLGTGVCEFWTSADVLCCTASILNLLAIALDRYWAVTNVDYIYKRTRRRVSLMILCAWTVGAVVSLAPIFGWKDPDFARRVLEEHKCLVSQDVGYQIFATISTFYSPLVLLLALYWRIFQVARERIRCKPGGKATVQSLASAKQHQPARLASMTTPEVMASVPRALAPAPAPLPPNGQLKSAPQRSQADSRNEIRSGADVGATDLIKAAGRLAGAAHETQTGVNKGAAGSGACGPPDCSLGRSAHNDKRALSCSSAANTAIIMMPPQTTLTNSSNATTATTTMTNEGDSGAGQAGRPQRAQHSNNVSPERLLDLARFPAGGMSQQPLQQTDEPIKMASQRSNESAPSGRQNDDQQAGTAPAATASRHQLPLLAHLHRQNSMDHSRLRPAAAARPARALPLGAGSVSPPEVASLEDECAAASSMQSLSECQCCCCYLHTTTSDDEDDEDPSKKTLGSTLSCGSATKWPQPTVDSTQVHFQADDDKLPLPHNILALANRPSAAAVAAGRHHRHSSAYSSSGANSASSSTSTTKSMLAAAAEAELDDSLGFLEQRLQQQQRLAQISLAKLVTQSSLASAPAATICGSAGADENNKSTENKLPLMTAANDLAPRQSIDKQIASGDLLRRPPAHCNTGSQKPEMTKHQQVSETARSMLIGAGTRDLSITVTSPPNEQQVGAAPPPSTLSVSIKRRFKVLGQMVSFVQTSRQFNSSSSAPTSQSGDEDDNSDDDDQSAPAEEHQQQHQQRRRVGACLEDNMAAAEAGSPAQTRNNQLESGALRLSRLNKQDSNGLAAEREPKGLPTSATSSSCNQQSALRRAAEAHPLPVSTMPGAARSAVAGVCRQQTRRQNLEMKREKKAAKTLAIITGVFVCCWLPFFVNAILMPICGLACTPSDLILSVLLWLGYLNSLLNPIIYTIFSPDFRRAFRRLLCWPSNASSSANAARRSGSKRPRGHRVGQLM